MVVYSSLCQVCAAFQLRKLAQACLLCLPDCSDNPAGFGRGANTAFGQPAGGFAPPGRPGSTGNDCLAIVLLGCMHALP